jgi:DNA-binding transcriptional ArsR family regulator
MSVVHNAPPAELAPTHVGVASGSAFDLLVALAAATAAPRASLDPDLRAALDAVGDTVGESWLNLLGVSIDAGAPYTARRLRGAVDRLDPIDLRLLLLGRYAWSWCTLAGTDTIEQAAAGDASAARRLLVHERYYAGRAREALSVLLALDPVETKRRLTQALDAGERSLLSDRPGLAAALADAETTAAEALEALPLVDAISRVTEGYRYVPEPEAERVLLVPHAEKSPALVLAQHHATRVIVYRARVAGGLEQRIAAVGHALSDPRRVEVLALLGRGVDRAPALVEATGLSRSTVHHHLAELRTARLVELEGNARAYRYLPRLGALEDTAALLAELLPEKPR